jgi:hypothetical protein
MIMYVSLTQSPPFFFFKLCPSSKLFKNTTFQKPALLPSSGNEAPNLGDFLDRAVLSHPVMSCFFKNLDNGKSLKKEAFVRKFTSALLFFNL